MTSTPPSDTARPDAAHPPRQPVAWTFLAAGLMDFTALRIVWLVSRHDPQVHVPAFVAYTLAFVMLTGSTMAVLKVLGLDKHMDWLIVPLMLGMTVTFGWVGLYGDPKDCSTSAPSWMPMPSCHVAFSAGALLMLLVTWLAARTVWRSFVARRSART